MPYQFLTSSDRQQLTSSLERLDAIWGGSVSRWGMLNTAGLGALVYRLRQLADSSAREFTTELVAVVEDSGWLGGQPPTHTLGALLGYFSNLPDIPRDIRTFYLSLLVRYELDDAARLTQWREELGNSAPTALPWEAQRDYIRAAPAPPTVAPQTIDDYLTRCWATGPSFDLDTNVQRFYHVPIRVRIPDNPHSGGSELYAAVQSLLQTEEQINHLRRVIILGDSGAGKSSALERLRRKQAVRSCQTFRRTKSRRDLVIPIFISLADLQTAADFRQLICAAINDVLGSDMEPIDLAQVDGLLGQYTCLFLLDALESVPQPGGVQPLRRFMEAHPSHRFVLTCRTSAYRGQLGGSVKTLFVDDFSEEEVKRVLGDRYSTLNRELRLLVRNRSLMKIVLTTDHSLNAIQSKGALLRIYYRDALRISDTFNVDTLELFLEELAFAMLASRSRSFGEYEIMQFAHKHIDEWHEPYSWRAMADVLRNDSCHAVLKRNEQRQWSFCDEQALAYYAAAAMARRPERIDAILHDIQGVWWRETLSFLIGLVHDPSALCYRLMDEDVYVAATSMRTSGRQIDGRVVDAMVDVLTERLSLQNSQDRRRTALLLGESGHPRALDVLVRALQRDWSSFVLVGILNAIAAWSQNNPAQITEKYLGTTPLDDTTKMLVQNCVDQQTTSPGRLPQIPFFRELTHTKYPPRVRGLAAIGLGFCQHPDARQVLLKLFERVAEEDAFVAWCVVEALAMYKDDAKVIEAAHHAYGDLLAAAANPRRAQAVYLLGWLKNDGSTTQLLVRALSDPDVETRSYAVFALARLDLLGARAAIEGQLNVEQEPRVLRAIAEALSEMGDLSSVGRLEQALAGNGAQARWAIQKAIREIRERHEMQADAQITA